MNIFILIITVTLSNGEVFKWPTDTLGFRTQQNCIKYATGLSGAILNLDNKGKIDFKCKPKKHKRVPRYDQV